MRKIKTRRLVVLSVFVILFLLISISGLAYTFYKYAKSGEFLNTFTTGSITFNYTEETPTVDLSNAYPVNDIVGKTSQNYFDFSVSGSIKGKTAVNYEIYFTPGVNNTIPEDYIKIYLTNSEDQPIEGFNNEVIPVYNELSASSSDETGKRLYLGTLTSTQTKDMEEHYRLRIWISSDYAEANSGKIFSVKVNVRAYN